MKKRVLISIIVALAGLATLAAQAVNRPAPTFSVKDLDNKTVSSESLKGKVVFINFWATWCPPCRAEIPDFVEFYNLNKGRGLEIVGFSVDELNPDELKSFAQKNKMTYPVVFATKKIILDFQPGQFIPTTIVLDKKGVIRYKQAEIMDKKTLAQLFQKLSAEK